MKEEPTNEGGHLTSRKERGEKGIMCVGYLLKE